MNTWTAKAHQLREAQAKILADILLNLDPNDPRTIQDTKHYGSPAGHEKKLRGIPVQMRGIGGTSPNTNPLKFFCLCILKDQTRCVLEFKPRYENQVYSAH
jgi:hypothetical protein